MGVGLFGAIVKREHPMGVGLFGAVNRDQRISSFVVN